MKPPILYILPILCAALVQTANANKIKMKLVPENPNAQYLYAVGTVLPEEFTPDETKLKYKKVGKGVDIYYNPKSTDEYLYVIKASEPDQKKRKFIVLRDAERMMTNFGKTLMVIREDGFIGFDTKEELEMKRRFRAPKGSKERVEIQEIRY